MASLDLGPSSFGFQKLVYRAQSCKKEVSSLLLYHTIVYTVIRRVFTFLKTGLFSHGPVTWRKSSGEGDNVKSLPVTLTGTN